MIENSFGYWAGFIMVNGATASDAQMVALYLMIIPMDNMIFWSKLFQLLTHP